MPVSLTYPGVYIEEVPSGVRTIAGVGTSITGFIGRARRGPVDGPVRIQSFADYTRVFGGFWSESTLGYAVHHYFMNGGADAVVVRIDNGGLAATVTVPAGAGALTLAAMSPGSWGNGLEVMVDHRTRDADAATPDTSLFNLLVTERSESGEALNTESFRNVSRDAASPRFITQVLEERSSLVRVSGAVPAARPDAANLITSNNNGTDGSPLTATQYNGDALQRTGLHAFEAADLINLLVIPPFERETDVAAATWAVALDLCRRRRALLLVDAPNGWRNAANVTNAATGIEALSQLRDPNAAIYFPWITAPDPASENRPAEFAPGGAVAGIFARTDAQRGVWKAPAGLDARVLGSSGPIYRLSDSEQGLLNPLAVNCLRTFPVHGTVVWGSRTMHGADRLGSEWKYVPVRRLTLFIEESLYRGTQWVVFEPNDEPLWSQIRLNIGTFMQNLFRQGAFMGASPRDAYFVRCGPDTTTQADVDLGIVNIHVGFAPLKPAEFVVIRIQQMAGQAAE
jgi:uncharacterized protein